MQVSVLDVNNVIYQGNALKVTLPTPEEELCILDFHQPFLCALVQGTVKISKDMNDSPGLCVSFPVQRGIAKMVRSNELSIMVEA